MLSRRSSLFIYVVVGLIISAAATPMGPDYNGEPKPRIQGPSYSQSHSPHPKYAPEKPYSKPYYQMDKTYAPREDKPYREEKKYPEQKKISEQKAYPKPRPEDKKYLNKSSDDKGKEHKSDDYKGHKSDDDKGRKSDNYKDRMSGDYMDRKSEDKDSKDLGKDYDKGRKVEGDNDRKGYDKGRKEYDNTATSCGNVGEQHCCDSVSTLDEAKKSDILSLLSDVSVENFSGLVGQNCAPLFGLAGKCEASTVCCKGATFKGIFAIGCTNAEVFGL